MDVLTHQQTRTLLQTAADRPLPPGEKVALEAHIRACAECRAYADNLATLQASLRRALHARWDAPKPALSVAQIKARSGRVAVQARSLATFGKLALVPLVVLAFFVTWLLTAGPQRIFPAVSAATIPAPGATFLTPTPPAHTLTPSAAQNCDRITYILQPNDTLDGIAARFSVSKASLMAYNGLSGDDLGQRVELLIPLCQSTSTPTTTTTLTP